MTDYIAYLEAQKKMIEQFDFKARAIAVDTATEADVFTARRPGSSWRLGLAESLRAAAGRLDQVAA